MSAPFKRANQSDIATRLGVSISTVSRALANEVGISEAVRRDVHKVAHDLGYKSKHISSGLNRDKRAVALVPLGGAVGSLANFYFGIVEGMRAEASATGLALDIRLVSEDAVTLDMIRRQVAGAQAKGILLTGFDPWPELAEWSAEAGVSAVLVNGVDPMMRFSSVSPANFYGAYMATKRLLDAGHRKILHYTHRSRPTILQRQRGFEAAMAAVPGSVSTIVSSAERTSQALAGDILAGKHDVTAAFCWNDIAAIQMMEGLFGRDGPWRDNFSIIGFDGLPVADIATPRLSTIRVDREGIGRSAIHLLVRQMDGETAIQQIEVGVASSPGETIFPA